MSLTLECVRGGEVRLVQVCRDEIPEGQVLRQDSSLLVDTGGREGAAMAPRVSIEVTKDDCVGYRGEGVHGCIQIVQGFSEHVSTSRTTWKVHREYLDWSSGGLDFNSNELMS